MKEQNMYAVMAWPTDQNKLSVHSLSKIKEPKKPWNEYKVGEKGKASYTGFKQLWPFEILAVGASKKDMDIELEKIIKNRLENAAHSEAGNNPVSQDSLAEVQTQTMPKDQQKSVTAKKRKPNDENNQEKTKPIKKRKVKGTATTKSNENHLNSDSDSEKECLLDKDTKRKALKSAVTSLLSNRSVPANVLSVAQQNGNAVSAPVPPQNYVPRPIVQQNLPPIVQNPPPIVQQIPPPSVQHNLPPIVHNPAPIVQNLTSVVQQNPAQQNFSTASTFQQNFAPPAYFNHSFEANTQNYDNLSTNTAPADFNSSFGFSSLTSTPNEKTYYNNVNHSINSVTQVETLDSYSSGLQESSSIISNARNTLYGETSLLPDMPETSQQNVPLGSMCHSCCFQIQALQGEFAGLKKAFEKLKKKNKKGEPASSNQNEITDTNEEDAPIVLEPELINGHTKEYIEKAAKESPNLTEAVKLTLGLCFPVKDLTECSLTGQRKNVKENKDPRPGLDDSRRIYLEGLLGRLFTKDVKEIRGKMRDRLKLFRRSHGGLNQI